MMNGTGQTTASRRSRAGRAQSGSVRPGPGTGTEDRAEKLLRVVDLGPEHLSYRRDHGSSGGAHHQHRYARRCPVPGRGHGGCCRARDRGGRARPRGHRRGVPRHRRAHRGGAGRGAGRSVGARSGVPRHHPVPARDHPGARGAGRARVRGNQGLGRHRRARPRRPRLRRADVVSPRVRRQQRADRAQFARRRGRRRPRPRGPAGRPRRGRAGRPRRPAGGGDGWVVRRGARPAARRLRLADRRARTADHLERPGPGPVPERRRGTREPAGRHAGPRCVLRGRGVQERVGRHLLLRWSRPRRRPGRSRGRGGGRRRAGHRTARRRRDPRRRPPAESRCTGGLRALHGRGLRRVHRSRHHRPAVARDRRAAASLLTGHRDRPHHRADAARPGRGRHPVRPRPGRRHRPPDRGGRRHGRRCAGTAVATTVAPSTRACATPSATWFDHYLAGRERRPGQLASATRSSAVCAPAPTRRPAGPSRHRPTPGSPGVPA